MNRLITPLIGAAMLLGGVLTASAVPANPVPRVFTQPDGTKLTLTQKGDEFCSYYLSEDKLVLRQDEKGWFRVVGADGKLTALTPAQFRLTPEASSYSAREVHQTLEKISEGNEFNRTAASRLYARSAGPNRVMPGGLYDNADGHDLRQVASTGSPHVLIILVNFLDKQFTYCSDPGAEMQKMMTEPGYSNFGCTGSALDFYTAQSRGIYTPKFDVYGPVQLSQNMAYYGGNVNGSDARVPELVKEACELLDGQVDFSQYDTNGDGYVDNVYVFYAGYGENDGGGASCIWPHSWSLHYTMTCPELDGVKIDRYACSNELRFTYDGSLDPTTIGTFCHEFGHVLGQPDVYATDYSDSFTPGSFDCMDHGSYNNDSRTPPNFSAYERYALEWLEPIEIKSATTINMLPLGDGGNVYKFTLDPDTPTDYFLFENRQQTGWDTYIPGHGMLVWHIDFNKSIWDANKPNNTPSHQRIDLIEADGVLSDGSQSADPFPGTKNIGEFTASTTPAFRSWTKFDSKLPITEIQESPAGVISFNVAGGSNTDELVMYAPAPRQASATANSLTVDWSPAAQNAPGYQGAPAAKKYILSVTKQMADPIFGDYIVEAVPGYEFTDMGTATSAEITGLEPSTTYQAQIYAVGENNVSPAATIPMMTLGESLEESAPLLQVVPNDVTALASWPAISGVSQYNLTVATRTETTGATAETMSFNNKNCGNWAFAGSLDEREDYCGQSAPSLRLNIAGATVMSDYYTDEIGEISFWARTNRQNAKLTLDFYAVADNGALAYMGTVSDVAANKIGTNVVLNNLPDGVHQFLAVYHFTTSDLILNLDDFVIKARGTATDTPLAGYDAKAVSGTTHTITGLQKSTSYVAWLTAPGSQKSPLIHFTTLAASGVDGIQATGRQPVFVVTGRVIRTDSQLPFSVYSLDGQLIASGLRGSFELPAPGLYIATDGTASAKLLAK